MSEELKKCPYCAAVPAIYGIATAKSNRVWKLRLGEELIAEGLPSEYDTREEAIAAWNRRFNDESTEH